MIYLNPVLHAAKPKLPDNPPEILSVDELRELLNKAAALAPDILPMLTIGAFAGLRDAEIKRLDWGEVNLVRSLIEVKGSKAKSARRRIFEMPPNLAVWLRPYSGLKGSMVPVGSTRQS
jgi:integrase